MAETPPVSTTVDTGATPPVADVHGSGPGSRSGRGRISRLAGGVIAVLLVLLIGAVAYGVSTTQTLTATRSQLSSTSTDLAGATTDLASSRAQGAQLASDKTELTSANKDLTTERARLLTNLAELVNQVSMQTQCIKALRANATELQRISSLASTNFNRSAKGSAWAKADTDALNDYYKAYRAAFSGQLATANSWIDKGNAALKTKSTQTKIIDAATKTIDAAESALAAAIDEAATACGF